MCVSGIIVGSVNAQIPRHSKSEMKERKESRRTVQDAQNVKLSKETKKEIKDLESEGWKPFVGSPSFAKQFLRRDQYEEGVEDGTWIKGVGTATGTDLSVVKDAALDDLKADIASKIEGEIVKITENTKVNKSGVSLNDYRNSSADMIRKKLGKIVVVVEMMKDNGYGSYSVTLHGYYSEAEKERIEQEIKREQLEQEASEIRTRLHENE